MNRFSVSMTLILPWLFALSLVAAHQAAASGPPRTHVGCTGSACPIEGMVRTAPRVLPLPAVAPAAVGVPATICVPVESATSSESAPTSESVRTSEFLPTADSVPGSELSRTSDCVPAALSAPTGEYLPEIEDLTDRSEVSDVR
ncbi:hypothetical protein ACTD5D_11870 [Nocardia takedensis]|uniref:hypothetical protein n=1 Tax=Nocardia takedensis TaxID=259390 RepID=UPI0002ED4AAC|nr:hypothetical protein [Nocardia takedensis]